MKYKAIIYNSINGEKIEWTAQNTSELKKQLGEYILDSMRKDKKKFNQFAVEINPNDNSKLDMIYKPILAIKYK